MRVHIEYVLVGLVVALAGWMLDREFLMGYGIGMAIVAVSLLPFTPHSAQQVAPTPADPPKEG